jgi:hypothetical protein
VADGSGGIGLRVVDGTSRVTARRSQVDRPAAGEAAGGIRSLALQLLADQLVVLEVVDSISIETVRKTVSHLRLPASNPNS